MNEALADLNIYNNTNEDKNFLVKIYLETRTIETNSWLNLFAPGKMRVNFEEKGMSWKFFFSGNDIKEDKKSALEPKYFIDGEKITTEGYNYDTGKNVQSKEKIIKIMKDLRVIIKL